MSDLFGEHVVHEVPGRSAEALARDVFAKLRDSKAIPQEYLCKKLGLTGDELKKALDFLKRDRYLYVEQWTTTRGGKRESFVRVTSRYPTELHTK